MQLVRFYPKYHCELSPIEMFWSDHKRFCRMTCKYKINELRKSVPLGLMYPCAETVRKYFARCRRYEQAYREQVAATAVGKVVKLARAQTHKYASHRAPAHSVGVLSLIVSPAQIAAAADASKCGCNDCRPDPRTICQQPMCSHHGVYTASDGPVSLSKQACAALVDYEAPFPLLAWDPDQGPGRTCPNNHNIDSE